MSSKPTAGKSANQQGVALLTAIFVVALATIAATALATSAAISLRRAENLQTSEIARWYAEGVESWAKSIIKLDQQSGRKYDSLADAWAQPVSFIPIDNGGIRGQIVDLQGLFNLNCLADKNKNNLKRNQEVFNRLLENLPNVDPNTTSGIADAITDWIDADDDRSGTGGFEDGDYLGLDPPYRAANQLMQSPSELMAVHGMTPKLYEALRPFVSTLPTTALSINVNTAPAPVLTAISSNLNSGSAQSWIADRIKNPAQSSADFQKAAGLQGTQLNFLVVQTSYLELRAEVVVGSARVALYSVINKQGGSSDPIVIAHSTDSD
jgi:general secretion pathway protein K